MRLIHSKCLNQLAIGIAPLFEVYSCWWGLIGELSITVDWYRKGKPRFHIGVTLFGLTLGIDLWVSGG